MREVLDLIQLAQKGDRQAEVELIQRYGPLILICSFMLSGMLPFSSTPICPEVTYSSEFLGILVM